MLDRNGGEAIQLTESKGACRATSGRRIRSVWHWSSAIPIPRREPAAFARDRAARPRVPKPIVIDRYKFKQDGQGYLLSGRHSYIYLFDIATKKLERLTKGKG